MNDGTPLLSGAFGMAGLAQKSALASLGYQMLPRVVDSVTDLEQFGRRVYVIELQTLRATTEGAGASQHVTQLLPSFLPSLAHVLLHVDAVSVTISRHGTESNSNRSAIYGRPVSPPR